MGISVRDQLGGSPEATLPDLSGQRKRGESNALEGQDHIQHEVGGGGAFSISKRAFGERVASPKRENVILEMRLKAALYRWGNESVACEMERGAPRTT